eukprot:TRINITY_DN1335_c0_g2_i1.p1 TRINITY_DN1335_c0_g2~~TRINITY_DN1335_c0_g2_i1.p1  ORF type:complete len:538 (+),score=114.38 TRINITY_DN1335_c0_g2_i1:262-1875(+)
MVNFSMQADRPSEEKSPTISAAAATTTTTMTTTTSTVARGYDISDLAGLAAATTTQHSFLYRGASYANFTDDYYYSDDIIGYGYNDYGDVDIEDTEEIEDIERPRLLPFSLPVSVLTHSTDDDNDTNSRVTHLVPSIRSPPTTRHYAQPSFHRSYQSCDPTMKTITMTKQTKDGSNSNSSSSSNDVVSPSSKPSQQQQQQQQKLQYIDEQLKKPAPQPKLQYVDEQLKKPATQPLARSPSKTTLRISGESEPLPTKPAATTTHSRTQPTTRQQCRMILSGLRKTFIPGIVIQCLSLGAVLGYYTWPLTTLSFDLVAHIKSSLNNYLFAMASAMILVGLIPWVVTTAQDYWSDQRRGLATPWRQVLIDGAFICALFAQRGLEKELLYQAQAWAWGTDVTVGTVAIKVCIETFVYTPLWATPFYQFWFAFKDSDYSFSRLYSQWQWSAVRFRYIGALLSTFLYWLPVCACVYCLPVALQVLLFSVVLCTYTLLLSFLTRRDDDDTASVATAATPLLPTTTTATHNNERQPLLRVPHAIL